MSKVQSREACPLHWEPGVPAGLGHCKNKVPMEGQQGRPDGGCAWGHRSAEPRSH